MSLGRAIGEVVRYHLVTGRVPESLPTRRRQRTVSVSGAAYTALARALLSRDGFGHFATHGGGVANAYNYPADTQGVLATATRDGRVTTWDGWLSAKGVTVAGVAGMMAPDVRPLYDDRYGVAAKAAARQVLRGYHRAAHARGATPQAARQTGRLSIHPDVAAFIRTRARERGAWDETASGVLADWLQEHHGASDTDAHLIRQYDNLSGLLRLLHERSEAGAFRRPGGPV